MADKTDNKERKQLEDEIWSAIGAFEQILEAMPDDRASLETLSHAYSQIGDQVKAREYLLRLAEVVSEDGDATAAIDLVERLRELGTDDTAAEAMIARLEATADTGPSGGASGVGAKRAPAVSAPGHVSMSVNMSEELAFTWNLLQAGEITQEEYASVVQDLTEMSSSESSVTVSVLHALEARGFKGLDRLVAFASQDQSTPFISLDSIDITEAAGAILPLEFVVRRGALVFDFVGTHGLAVIMNPYDAGLRRDVELLADRKCHFFITHASEFDRAVERITNIEVE